VDSVRSGGLRYSVEARRRGRSEQLEIYHQSADCDESCAGAFLVFEKVAMKDLLIGNHFRLPMDLITMTVAILGIRGSGKTNTATVFAEGLLKARQQVVIIDPQDVWYGLKSSADGKAPGYPVIILGGKHADLPIKETDGRLVAEFVVRERAAVILSLRHLSKTKQRQFVTDFSERMYEMKDADAHRTPVAVIIDEAAQFIPQQLTSASARMIGAVGDLVTLGRASGIGVTLIDQRPAKIHKDVLTQLEMMIVHRIVSPQDRDALDEWIKVNGTTEQRREFIESLARLGKGEAYVWSPHWLDLFKRVQVRLRETFDSSRTPRIGERPVIPERLAEVNLERLRQALAETIEEVKQKDPRELRKQIAELTRRLDEKSKAAPPQIVERSVPTPVIDQAEIKNLERLAEQLQESARQAIEGATIIRDAIERAKRNGLTEPPPEAKLIAAQAETRRTDERHRATVTPRPAPRRAPTADDNGDEAGIGRGALLRILIALAQNRAGLTDRKLAVLTNLRRGGSTMRNALSKGRMQGLIERGALRITSAGVEALGQYEPLPTGAALRRYWQNELGSGAARQIFDLLIEAYPGEVDKQAIARATSLTLDGSTMRNALSRLRVLELVPRGELRAADVLFE
jgi:hypothetical protein